LHDRLPADQQAVFAQVLSNVESADEAVWDGLLIVPGESATGLASPEGVIWVQLAAGNTAVIWASPEDSAVGRSLLTAAAVFVDARRIPLTQMVIGEQDGYSHDALTACGFPKFAALAYLFAEASQLPPQMVGLPAPDDAVQEFEGLHFVPRAGDEPPRLAKLLEHTYVDTLDCPALDGIRSMPDVLEGYRSQGRYAPGDWYFVEEQGADVGTLLLTEHPGHGNWELVYMGVIPEARGRRLSDRIVNFALEVASRRGAERLVLAVDEANTPALRAYERAGFVVWDRRIVYARLRTCV
jgi:GNAT superfamily N-acetyltransferase